MLTLSQVAKRRQDITKRNNQKKSSSPTLQRTKDAQRRKEKQKRDKLKVEKLLAEAERSQKLSVSGKRICGHEGCITVLSLYNNFECCSLHQLAWNMRNNRFIPN